METRNLDFETPVTEQQWEQLGMTAERLGRDDAGFEWSKGEPGRIKVLLRDEDAQGFWNRYVSPERLYGNHDIEVARFVFNDGRPYAELEELPHTDEPAINDMQEQAVEAELSDWVRDRWHALMRESGVHYTRGHVPTDLPQPE